MSEAKPTAGPTEGGSPGRFGRWTRYASWTALDQFFEIGFPSLILLPILLALLGEHINGILLLALSCVRFVGIAPSSGLASFIMRDASHQDPAGRDDLLRTVMVLSAALMVPIVLGFVGLVWYYGVRINQPELLVLLPWFAIYLVTLNLTHTIIMLFRFHRTFDKMVLVHGLQAVLQLLAIPLFLQFGIAGIGPAFAFAGLAGLGVACWMERRALLQRPLYRPEFVRGAMRVWVPVAISSLLMLSAGPLDRLMLGAYWEPKFVSFFAASAATARLLLIPGAQANNLLFSMLGKFRSSGQFSRRFYLQYLVAAIVVAVLVCGVGFVVAPWILRGLFPSVTESAQPLLPWTIAAIGGLSVHAWLRPFVNKFLPPAYMPWMAGLSVIARLTPLFLLVPAGGAMGAAKAMFIGAVATASIWMAVYVWNFLISTVDHSSQVTVSPR